MMKYCLHFFIFALLTLTATAADDLLVGRDKLNPDPSNLYCVGRGMANIGTAIVELPRNVVYENYEFPVMGSLIGLEKGAFFTMYRMFAGLYDVMSLGFSGNLCYGDKFPDLVFYSPWQPDK